MHLLTFQTHKIVLFLLSTVLGFLPLLAFSATPLADRPVYDGVATGNVALALSVEYPTGVTSAYQSITTYQKNDTYLGYFDAEKCYAYTNSESTLNVNFYPTGVNDSGNVLSAGRNDRHWSLVDKPRGLSRSQRRNLNDASGSYNTATAGHIGRGAGSVPSGRYSYRSDLFYLPASVNPSDVSLSFELMPDDRVVEIQINGVSKPYSLNRTPSWNTPAIVTMPAGTFSTLGNELTIVIENTGYETGFRVDQIRFVNSAVNSYGKYFTPVAHSASNHSCRNSTNGRWSGNFLNWSLMQVIDPFRQTLTGGYRSVDEVNKTILEKAYADGKGGKLGADRILNGVDVRDSTPFDHWSYLKLRINHLGIAFYITGSTSTNIDSPSSVSEGSTIGASPDANGVYTFDGRVEVCVPGLLESSCEKYPSGSYKPMGLIQKHANKLRFSVFGYLNDSNIRRDGGVMRARMSSVGPDGDFPEWDENTGVFYANPHPADALASGVTRSGVINYLNEYGYSAPGYKTFDPLSEMFYAIGRYFRNKGNVASYSSNTTAFHRDGFPVINNWGDPIRYSCESNFIIGLGDSRTHSDANLPGSTIRSGYEPAMPTEVSNDYGSVFDTATHFTDVFTSTKRVGDLEGVSNLHTTHPGWCCGTGNSFFMSGIAYDLHTRDMRFDMTGKQTVSTYWLDVLEAGQGQENYERTLPTRYNQLWYATKYGGFDVADDYDPYSATITPLTQSDWDANNDGDPDHYFRANNPKNMSDSLSQTFDSIANAVDKATTRFALENPNVAAGDKSFSSTYKSAEWSGTVFGNSLTFDVNGNPIETKAWSTDTAFENQVSGTGWDSQRLVATSNCVAVGSVGEKQCTGVPFRLAYLSTDNSAYLDQVGIYSGVALEVVNYLRGDRALETKYRKRSKVLGDIVHSKLAPVGAPNAPYSDSFNPGYSAFKAAYQSRPTVVYVGANDGMLHAFHGDTGNEVFAYVPQALYRGHDGDTAVNGLVALASPGYQHRFYVDASPAFYDVNFGSGSSDWHTLMMGGLGKGGKSYFALDITNPAAITSELAAADKLLWEFSHDDLGFTYGRPISVKVDGKWVVIFTSGYNNQDGKGYFFVVDPKTGTLINKVSTGAGSTSSDAGLAHLTAYIADGKDFTADAVYAGDLLGNVWRLDLAGIATPGYVKAPELIATLRSSSGQVQPITTSPIVELDQVTKERLVFIGTGRVLDETDLPVTASNSIYVIKDGNQANFYTNTSNPVGGFPINTRSVMVNHTGNVGEVISDSSKPMGYYIDLDSGFYINEPMTSSAGVFAAFANKIIGSTCERNALYRGYVLNYASGESLITNANNGIATQYVEGTGLGTSVTIYKQPNSAGLSVNFSHDSDSDSNTSLQISNVTNVFKVLNWRLVPIE